MAYCELGEFALAVEPFKQALALGPESPEVYFTVGEVYAALGQKEKAALAARDALRLDPSASDAYLLLGWALHEPGTLAEAVAAYEKSLELKPGQLQALAYLGDAYLQLGRLEEAREAAQRVRQIVKDLKIQPAPAGTDISVGAELPQTIKLETIPNEIAAKVPQIKSHQFLVKDDKVVLVEPKDHRVVEVIE